MSVARKILTTDMQNYLGLKEITNLILNLRPYFQALRGENYDAQKSVRLRNQID